MGGIDIRRFYPVLYPLVFMKSTTAVAYLGIYLFAYRYPAFLAVALYDGLCLFLMIYFAGRAHRALEVGINFIDTAEVYGPYKNEELVGRALAGRRRVIAGDMCTNL